MKVLIKSATICDPHSAHNGKKRDILIDNGSIHSIKASISAPKGAQVIEQKDLHVSPGWFDTCVDFCEPGNEHREDLFSGLDAAAKGGFTGVLIMPGTSPAVSTKSQVEFILSKTEMHPVQAEVAACLSDGHQGKQIAEFGDLTEAGALGFTDYKKGVDRSELMIRALDYARNFDQLVISFPHDAGISPGGLMNEGATSVSLGLKGIPVLSETARLKRDLDFLEYTGGKLHVALISCKESVQLIKEARKKGLDVTCGVSANHLRFTEEDLVEFDTRLKVMPPFRSKADRKALIKGLKDGVIDVICSDHSPIDVDHKKIEFEYAEEGISGIESAAGVSLTAVEEHLSLDEFVEKWAINPRQILDIEVPVVNSGEQANLTLFNPNSKTTFSRDDMQSKSQNNPYDGVEFTGQVYGIVNGGWVALNV